MTLEEYLLKKYRESTLKSNLHTIKRFTDYYRERAETACYKDVLRYIEHLRKNHDLHPKTLRHCLYGVKIYFNYLLETGRRNDHPCSELLLKDKIDKQIQVDKLYSTEALENFLQSHQLRRKKHLQRRNQVIISLLIYQALTVTEIARLETGDTDLEKGEIHIRGNHHQQSRVLPLQARQVLLFYSYLNQDRDKLLKYNKLNPAENSFILGQYGQKLNPHCISKMINENRPENEKIQPLRIRQSVIANLLKKENDIRVVQVFAGHCKASTTEQYRLPEFESLQSAVNAFHPLK